MACSLGNADLVHNLLAVHKLSVFSTDRNGNTPLHIAVAHQQIDCILVLLQYNAPLFSRNNSGERAIDITNSILSKSKGKNVDIAKNIKDLLQQNKGSCFQATYEEQQVLSKRKFSGKKNVTRLFVVGHSEAGKTTLIETLKKEGFANRLFGGTTVVPPHTAGIVPSTHDSEQYGRLVFYDFAGEREYYSSHAAILKMLGTSEGVNIILILINLSQSEDTISNQYGYWLTFVSSNILNTNSFVQPVGSFADKLKQYMITEKLETIDNVSGKFRSDICIKKAFSLDCRKSGRDVNHVKGIVREASLSVPPVTLTLEASTLLGLLLKDFGTVPAFELKSIISHIDPIRFPLSGHPLKIYSLLKELHDLGLIMIIAKEGDPVENHLIILNISSFTSEVHRKLFSEQAKVKFSEQTDKLKLSVGIITESLLQDTLPEYITKECLIKLQYCQEIENVNVEEDYTLTQELDGSIKRVQKLLFFPALCMLRQEDMTWPEITERKYALGWYARCEQNIFDYFPPRFLHVLIVQLSKNFALKQHTPISSSPIQSPVSSLSSNTIAPNPATSSALAEVHEFNPRCHVWATGLHWLMENGVEVYVDIPKDAENKELVLITRCSEDCRAECVNTLREVIQKVIEAKIDNCYNLQPSIYLLDSVKLAEIPFTNARSVPLYSLRDVEKTLIEEKPRVVSVDGLYSIPPTKLARWKMTYWGKS